MKKNAFIIIFIGVAIALSISLIFPEKHSINMADSEHPAVNITGEIPPHWHYFFGGMIVFVGFVMLLLSSISTKK